MCKALLKNFASINQKMPHSQLKQKIGANDPGAKALGYDGLADPMQEFVAKQAGERTILQRKQERLRDQRALASRTAERTPTGGHLRSIAAFKAAGR